MQGSRPQRLRPGAKVRSFLNFSSVGQRHGACPSRWSREGTTMIALKRILVPHDFSDTSAAAVRYAVELARNFGSRLYFLHVGDDAVSQFEAEFPIGLEDALADGVRERLLRMVTPEEKAELNPDFAVRPGAPAAEIVRFANDQDIDLIVMGTHG